MNAPHPSDTEDPALVSKPATPPHHGRNGSTPAIANRILPHSIEAEEGLLGAILIDPEPVLELCRKSRVGPWSFYDTTHGVIFSRVADMVDRKVEGVDVSLLAEDLKACGRLEEVGGYSKLTQITKSTPTTVQARYFIDRISKLQGAREIIHAAQVAIEAAYVNHPDNLAEVAKSAISGFERAISNRSRGGAYTVWNPARLRAYDPPPNMDIIAGGYVRRRQLTTLIGPPGVGKSRLSLWLACCQICGRAFGPLQPLKNDSHRPAKWLFFGNENDPMRQKSDLDWFYRNLSVPEQNACDAHLNLHVLDKPDDSIITLADPDAYAKLIQTMREQTPDVIVFDPWANMIEGNENDNEEVRRTLRMLLKATSEHAPESAIIVIHHARTGKNTAIEAGNNYSGGSLGRGSKALVSAARCEMALWPGDSDDSSKLVLTCEKANNQEKFKPHGLIFANGIYAIDPDFSVDAWRDDIEGVRGGKTLTIKDVVEAVRSGCHKAGSIADYCQDHYGTSKPTTNRRLSEACQKGYLQRTEPTGSYTLGNKICA